jgi:hypothetical protein
MSAEITKCSQKERVVGIIPDFLDLSALLIIRRSKSLGKATLSEILSLSAFR